MFFTGQADEWCRAREIEIGTALCTIGEERTLTFRIIYSRKSSLENWRRKSKGRVTCYCKSIIRSRWSSEIYSLYTRYVMLDTIGKPNIVVKTAEALFSGLDLNEKLLPITTLNSWWIVVYSI